MSDVFWNIMTVFGLLIMGGLIAWMCLIVAMWIVGSQK